MLPTFADLSACRYLDGLTGHWMLGLCDRLHSELQNGASIADLKARRCKKEDILRAGFSSYDIRLAGYSTKDLQDLKKAGCPVYDLLKARCSQRSLPKAGYNDSEITAAEALLEAQQSMAVLKGEINCQYGSVLYIWLVASAL